MAEIAAIVWEECGNDPAELELRAPAELRGRRAAALAVGREGAPGARLGGAGGAALGLAETVEWLRGSVSARGGARVEAESRSR